MRGFFGAVRIIVLAVLLLALLPVAQGLPSAPDRSAPWAFAAEGHASARGGSSSGPPAAEPIPGRYIVVLSDDADPDTVARSFVTANGLAVHHVYRTAFRGFAASIPDAALPGIARYPSVAFVSPDRTMYAAAQALPTGVDRIDAERNRTARIDGTDARVDAGIAIIDTGVDLDHPDLNVVFGRSFVAGEPTADDPHGHGTHVAGTAAALDNGIGVVGVAPGARIYALKVLDATGVGSVSDITAAIDWVAANAGIIDVASLSLGGLVPNADDGNCGRTNRDALHLAICNAVAAGVTVVVAAGNDRVDAKDVSPAAYDEALTVSGLSDLDGTPLADRFTFFSNFGADVDLIAPGRAILSTWRGGGTAVLTGTSMSTPHVSGAAALYIASVRAQAGSRPSPEQVAAFLKSHGEPAPSGGWPGDSDGIPEPLVKVRDLPAGPIDATASVVVARPARIEADGESTTMALAMPRDANRNLVGPGHVVRFAATAGDLLGSSMDGGTDVYSQVLRGPADGMAGTTAEITATADATALAQSARIVFTEDLLIHGSVPIIEGPEHELDPALASDGRGYLAAWWTLSADQTRATVRAVRIGADGSRIDGTPILLDQMDVNFAVSPMVPIPKVASDGSYYLVVWLSKGAIIRGSDGVILASLTFDSSSPRFGATAAFDGSKYLVLWYEFDRRTANYALVGQFVSRDGVLLSRKAFPIVAAASPAVWIGESPAVAFDGANFVIAFSRLRIGPCPSNPTRACALDSDVYAVRLSPAGSVLAPGLFLLAGAPGYQRFAAAVSDRSRSVVAWESVFADVETGAMGSAAVDLVRIGLDGKVLDSVPIRLEGPAEMAFGPAVAPRGGDTFLVAWTNGSHPDDWDISAARVRGDTGQVLDPVPFPISAAPADQLGPALGASESNLLAAFVDFGRYAVTRADVTGQLVRRFELPLEVTIQAPWTDLAPGQTMQLTVLAASSGSAVSGASVTASVTPGGLLGLSPASGTTDAEGVWTTMATALSEGQATVAVIVTKAGFTQGSATFPIRIGIEPLAITVSSERIEMMAFETATVRVRLTDAAGIGVGDAIITATSAAGGNFSAVANLGAGDYRFRWDAPRVSVQTFVTILVAATVGGFADARARLVILVDPNKTNPGDPAQLFLIAEPERTSLRPGDTINVTLFLFTVEGFAVSGATVGLSTLGAVPVVLGGVVDRLNGVYTFTVTAGSVGGATGVSIRIDASKFGYRTGTTRLGFLIVP